MVLSGIAFDAIAVVEGPWNGVSSICMHLFKRLLSQLLMLMGPFLTSYADYSDYILLNSIKIRTLSIVD